MTELQWDKAVPFLPAPSARGTARGKLSPQAPHFCNHVRVFPTSFSPKTPGEHNTGQEDVCMPSLPSSSQSPVSPQGPKMIFPEIHAAV